MSVELVLAIVGAVVIPLQAATFAYVVRIERRLTRLEVIEEVRRDPAPARLAMRARGAA